MIPILLLIVSLVLQPDFSESCQNYDALCGTPDYQLRHYKKSVWVGTVVDSILPISLRELVLHVRFAEYYGQRIKNPRQVLISYGANGDVKLYLKLSDRFLEKAPKPTNPRLFIAHFPDMDMFSRIIRKDIHIEAAELKHKLVQQKAPIRDDIYFVTFCMTDKSKAGGKPDAANPSRELLFIAKEKFKCPGH